MRPNTPQYDFILLGGGSAGCALAARLSADPQNRVLVLEAGRLDSLWDIFIHMPAALTIPLGNPRYDWCYESEPEPHMGGAASCPRSGQGPGRLLELQRDDLHSRQPARLREVGP